MSDQSTPRPDDASRPDASQPGQGPAQPGYEQPAPPYGQGPAQPSYGQPHGQGPAQPSYGQPYGQGQPGYMQPPVSPSDERLWSMLAHLGGILFHFLPSLIIFLVYKDRSALIRDNAKEALNFQITLAIAEIIAGILIVVFIGAILLPLVEVAALVFCILGGVTANRGNVVYRYPVSLRLVR